MKKSILIAMATTLALASCQTDDILDNSGSTQNANNAIRFDGEAGKMSRADDNGDHTKLGDKFVVYGTKTTTEGGSDKVTVVYNNYNVAWQDNTTNSPTNPKGWEYVGVGTNSLNTGATAQTIKYWDYSAKQYDFVAFSFGTATQGDGDDKIKAEQDGTNKLKYTLTGKLENLAKCYFADKVTVSEKDQFSQPVQFKFRSTTTKVKIKLYETINGYSVKDVKFYKGSEVGSTPTLNAESATIPAGKGKMIIDFSNTSTPATYEAEASQNANFISFGELSTVGKEGQETAADGKYIGRNSTDASAPTEFTSVLPANAGKLTLKVDYTLESIDGSGEEIKVTGATAEIPADYTQWKANYAYTYIFKISDKSNGSTGGESSGLHPITFDAIVTEAEDGSTTFEEIELKEPSSTPARIV